MAAAESADLVLELRDARSLDDNAGLVPFTDRDAIVVWTKSDLADRQKIAMASGDALVSSVTGAGIEALLAMIHLHVSGFHSGAGEVLPTRTRHKLHLEVCLRELNAAIENQDDPIELRTEYLRNAASALGRITGTVDVEDLLGVIFSEFCVGK